MATELFFALNTASRKVTGTYPTTATNYANMTSNAQVTTEGFMVPYKWRGVANLTMSSNNTTQARRYRFGRFFSAPFYDDYTFAIPTTSANAIKFFLADYQSNLNANFCIQQVCIYVWRPSTGQVVGTIVPVQTLATGTKEATATNSIQGTLGSYFNAAGGSVACKAGDILVFEPWASVSQGANTAYTIRFYYGGATDVVTENTTYTTPASRVLFPYDLPLGLPIGTVSGIIAHRWESSIVRMQPLFKSNLKVCLKSIPAELSEVVNLKSTNKLSLRALPARMDNVPPFGTYQLMHTRVTAKLTGRTQLNASLKLISNMRARIPEAHRLQVTHKLHTISYVTAPDPMVGDSLALYYSGQGTADAPQRSLGGVIGGAFTDRTLSSVGIAVGVEILAAVGLPDGTHRLRVDAASREVTLFVSGTVRRYSVLLDDKVDVLVIGSHSVGFVVVRAAPSHDTDVTIPFTTAEKRNALFLNPTATELLDGTVQYRCLYLFNRTDQDAIDVRLTVTSPEQEQVTVATEFVSDVGFVDTPPVPSIRRAATDITGWGGIEFVGGVIVSDMDFAISGLPFMPAPTVAGQSSDGQVVQIPVQLHDQEDSTGILPGMSFGDSVSWPLVRARRGVSFWVRKVMPPGDGAAAEELTAQFTVSAEF